MLSFVENLLANRSTMVFLMGLFVVSQTWILATLGTTGPDVAKLQTVCLMKPSPSSTGEAARQILEKWTSDDIARFQRHYILDLWVHPVLYALFFISAFLCDWKKKNEQSTNDSNKKQPNDETTVLLGRIVTILILIGATCDILENQRHSSIQFEPTLEASDALLWEACLFASTKWVVMKSVAGWLFWRFFWAPTSQQQCTKPLQSFDADWTGPRPEDHLNTPCEAAGLSEVQGRKIPWTLSAPGSYSDAERSYVTSPWGHYFGYCMDEIKIRFADSPIVQCLVLGVVQTVGFFFHLLSFDESIYFNNKLLSTNLWPSTIQWSQNQVESINQELLSISKTSREKDRAIVWRSVDPLSQPELTKVLSKHGSCMMLPARVVNWSDYSGEDYDMKESLYKKGNFKRDISYFKRRVGWDVANQKNTKGCESAHYEMATIPANELTQEQAARIIDLFNQLYLDKYSKRNPQLTLEGLVRMAKTGFLTVDVLRERQSGAIMAFSTGSTTDGVRTPSFIGYDLANDSKKELYRLVMMMIHCNLIRDGVTKMHHSGGANEFKRHRGATTTVEYSAVFIDHLPWHRQLPWKLAKAIADRIITVKNAH